MLGIVITTITFLIAMILTRFSIASEEVNANWEAQRCRPDVMLMAGMYGKDVAENINFCLKSTFDTHSMEMSNPFYSIMGVFTQVLSTMISSINSVKVIFATIIGSTFTIFNEFSSRIKTLLYTIQNTAIRMKFMMGRVLHNSMINLKLLPVYKKAIKDLGYSLEELEELEVVDLLNLELVLEVME
jgi:hypothetical protein